jgi:hypothetical protein
MADLLVHGWGSVYLLRRLRSHLQGVRIECEYAQGRN